MEYHIIQASIRDMLQFFVVSKGSQAEAARSGAGLTWVRLDNAQSPWSHLHPKGSCWARALQLLTAAQTLTTSCVPLVVFFFGSLCAGLRAGVSRHSHDSPHSSVEGVNAVRATAGQLAASCSEIIRLNLAYLAYRASVHPAA